MKIIATIANDKGLAIFHLDVSEALVLAPFEERVHMRLPTGCCELSGKLSYSFLSARTALNKPTVSSTVPSNVASRENRNGAVQDRAVRFFAW